MRKLNEAIAPRGYVPSGASPMVYADTRQQYGKHKNIDSWFIKHGIYFEYKKLDFGDYVTAQGISNVSIDTKQDVMEVAGNLGRDNRRFKNECVRAQEAGYRLYILIEEKRFTCIDDVYGWFNPVCAQCRLCNPRIEKHCKRFKRKPMQAKQIVATMRTFEAKYGVRFLFCSRRDTARIICELLGVVPDG